MKLSSLAACLVAVTATGSAMAASRGFPVPGFDRITSNVPFDVRVHTGRRPAVVANGDNEVLDRLDVTVRDGALVIGMRRGISGWMSGWRPRRAMIDVTVPGLRAAALNGPGNLAIDRIRGRDLSLDVSGPGTLSVGTVETASLTGALSGPGNVAAAGRAGAVRISASGPGNVRFARLLARDVDVVLSGPGNVDANASGTATIRLSGPGDVSIGGTPRCRVEKHGPGSVRCG